VQGAEQRTTTSAPTVGGRAAVRLPGTGLEGLRRRLRSLTLAPAYRLYTRRLRRRVAEARLPRHVAVILDGNRRWASRRGLRDLAAGYRQGAEKLEELLGWCRALGIGELTVWALSGENLAREPDELQALLAVLAEKLAELSGRRRVRIRVFGRLEALPAALAATARDVERATAGNDGLRLNVALGYSGRDELVDAVRALVRSLAARGVSAAEMAEHVDAEALAGHLYTAGHPDPDLIIRTSGEMRLSGFLPWQSSHSELFFADVYWPAFRELDFLRAVRTFQQRERRFGR
jgi:short-chain Z-isoprenyl diphosphate synthase